MNRNTLTPLLALVCVACPEPEEPPLPGPRCEDGVATCRSDADCAGGVCDVLPESVDGVGCCIELSCEVGRTCEGPQGCEPGFSATDCDNDDEVCLFNGQGPGVCTPAEALQARVAGCEFAREVVVTRANAEADLSLRAFDAEGYVVPFLFDASPPAVSSALLANGLTAGSCDVPPACVAPIEVNFESASCSATLVVLANTGTHVVVNAGSDAVSGASVSALVGDVLTTLETDENGLASFDVVVPAALVDAPGFRRELRALGVMNEILIELVPSAPTFVEVEIEPEVAPEAPWFALAGRGHGQAFELGANSIFGSDRTLESQLKDVADLVLPANVAQQSGVWEARTSAVIEDAPPYGRWALSTETASLTGDVVAALTNNSVGGAATVLSETRLHDSDLRASQPGLQPETRRRSNSFTVDIPPIPACSTEPCADLVASLAWVSSEASGFVLVGAAFFRDEVPPSTAQVAAVAHDGLESGAPHQVVVGFSLDKRFESAIVDEALDAFPDDRADLDVLGCDSCDVLIADAENLELWASRAAINDAEALLAALGIDDQWGRAQALLLLPGLPASDLAGTSRGRVVAIAGWTSIAR